MKKIILSLVLGTVYAGADVHPDHHHEHHQGVELVGSTANIPSVKIKLEKDRHSTTAVNLKVSVNNFLFAPEHVNQEHQLVDREIGLIVEGHAHIYVNDVKLTRLYGPHYFLQNVKQGDIVRVELNSNDHRVFLVNGERVATTEEIVPELSGHHDHH